jgi:GNAT superfamily N-acetyltransferase
MTHIKLLTPEELPTALADLQLMAETGHAPDFNFFGPELIFVYTINGGIVAFGCLACYDGVWALRNCVVHPAYRGRGIQVHLIKKRVEYARNQGAREVVVWVEPHNAGSLNNLVKCGFRHREEPLKVFHGKQHIKLGYGRM